VTELRAGAGTGTDAWQEDFLGPQFQYRELSLAPDDEGDVCATLIRCVGPAVLPPSQDRPSGPAVPPASHNRPSRGILPRLRALLRAGKPSGEENPAVAHGAPVRAVLYLHGWADYFLQAELAEHLAAAGFHFYALDLRKFGRSLRQWQTPGYTTDLAVYDEDLDAAMAAIRADLAHLTGPDTVPVMHLLAHSLGGLIAALWANRHPGSLATLTLNAPWLELQGSSLIRNIAMHLVDPVARTDPRRPFRFPEMPGYWQSVSSEAHGEWQLDPVWRPVGSFPVRAGWAKAVLAGHAAIQQHLDIDAPVLVMLSDRTRIQSEWSAELMRADAVIDVEETSRRALRLGRRIAVFRYPGAIHDVFLSRRRVREEAYRDLTIWLQAYPG
jgi:alpha-beta hydrolase superfamily lysophospholipase